MGTSNKSFAIVIALLLLLFVAAIFYVTKDTRNIVPFTSEPDKVLKDVLDEYNKISPIKVAKQAMKNDPSVVFIDIRNQYKYLKGHLPNAKNIYKADILNKENINYFHSLEELGKQAILYGDDVVEANAPFMILKQIGIENIVLMESGYSFFENNNLKAVSEMGELEMGSETAALDFAELIKNEKIKYDKISKEEEKVKINAIKSKKNNLKINKKKEVIFKRKQAQSPIKEIEKEEDDDEGC